MIVALHGASAATHDYHAGAAGDFAAALDALDDARAAGKPARVTTALTRSSYRALAALPALLADRGVAAWNVAVVRFADTPPEARARRVPRLALAVPFALHALERAAGVGVAAYVTGAPRCLLGPFAARALAGPTASYPAPCDGCAARAACPGVEDAYVARFGAGELRPLPTPGPLPPDDAHARAFAAGT